MALVKGTGQHTWMSVISYPKRIKLLRSHPVITELGAREVSNQTNKRTLLLCN